MTYEQIFCAETIDWDGFIDAARTFTFDPESESDEASNHYNWDAFNMSPSPALPGRASDNPLNNFDWDIFGAALRRLKAQ